MKTTVYVFLIFLFISSSSAQKQGRDLLDSLRVEADKAPDDTSTVRLLGRMSFLSFQYDTDQGIAYAERAIALAERLGWKTGLAFSYNYLGTNYAVKGNYSKALEYFHTSLSFYTEIGDAQGIGFLSNNLGNLYRILKNYPKAVEYCSKAAALNEALKNERDLGKTYNNLGNIYSEMSDLPTSNEYYNKALLIARESGNRELAALLLINLADNKTKTRDYCEALALGKQAIRISEDLNVTYDRASYTSFVGEIYFRIATDTAAAEPACRLYAKNKRENLLHARDYLTVSISLLDKINDLAMLSDNSLLLSRIYEELGDTKNALSHYKKYSQNKDSVFSKDNSVTIAGIEKKKEIELRDKQIIIQSMEIEKQNSQIVFQIVLFVLILMLTAIIPYLYYKRRETQKQLEGEREKRRLEQQLLQAQKLEGVGTLAGGIAHDFNNLLAMILGSAELLQMQVAGRPELKAYVDRIIEASERGSSISRQLLIFSRPDQATFSPLSVSGAISELHEMLRHFLPKSVTVSVDTAGGNALIMGDPGQIHQALLNLALNAGDAMANSGTLTIREFSVSAEFIAARFPAAARVPHVAVSVADTGMGMDEVMIAKIFDPFFSTKEKGKGTGLGLAMVHGIVKNHNGFIDVQSAPGSGTTFTLYFPAAAGIAMDSLPAEARADRNHTGTILVVDDEQVLREMLFEFLSDAGYVVHIASNGSEALELFRSHRESIDLVITDLGMPGMGGEELYRQLRAIDAGVRVMVSSGFVDGTTKEQLLDSGICGILKKPYRLNAIREEIITVMGQTR